MNKTISLLILASAAVHVAVLGLIDFNSPTNIIVAGSLMRISIQAPSSTAAIKSKPDKNNIVKTVTKSKSVDVQTKPETARIIKKPITVKQKAVVKQVTQPQHNNLATTQTSTVEPKRTIVAKLENISASTSNTLPESTTSLLHSNLERAFALHFYYPRIAIKRGWQGEVKISLRIEADGHLSRVRLLNSSGYNLLDKAAMASIDKVQILPTAIALLDGQTMDLILPVEYHLL